MKTDETHNKLVALGVEESGLSLRLNLVRLGIDRLYKMLLHIEKE